MVHQFFFEIFQINRFDLMEGHILKFRRDMVYVAAFVVLRTRQTGQPFLIIDSPGVAKSLWPHIVGRLGVAKYLNLLGPDVGNVVSRQAVLPLGSGLFPDIFSFFGFDKIIEDCIAIGRLRFIDARLLRFDHSFGHLPITFREVSFSGIWGSLVRGRGAASVLPILLPKYHISTQKSTQASNQNGDAMHYVATYYCEISNICKNIQSSTMSCKNTIKGFKSPWGRQMILSTNANAYRCFFIMGQGCSTE